METSPVSIFATQGTQGILNRLATIKAEAADYGTAIPAGVVHELFKALEGKLPEVGPAIEEIQSGSLSLAAIEDVLLDAKTALDARNAYLAAA